MAWTVYFGLNYHGGSRSMALTEKQNNIKTGIMISKGYFEYEHFFSWWSGIQTVDWTPTIVVIQAVLQVKHFVLCLPIMAFGMCPSAFGVMCLDATIQQQQHQKQLYYQPRQQHH